MMEDSGFEFGDQVMYRSMPAVVVETSIPYGKGVMICFPGGETKCVSTKEVKRPALPDRDKEIPSAKEISMQKTIRKLMEGKRKMRRLNKALRVYLTEMLQKHGEKLDHARLGQIEETDNGKG